MSSADKSSVLTRSVPRLRMFSLVIGIVFGLVALMGTLLDPGKGGIPMTLPEMFLTALRAAAVYLALIALVRLFGKRGIGAFRALDIVTAIFVVTIAGQYVAGSLPLPAALLAAGVVCALHWAEMQLRFYDRGFRRLLHGRPTIVVRDGRLEAGGLRKERMNEDDLLAELRRAGIESLREVLVGAVELDGSFTIRRRPRAEESRPAPQQRPAQVLVERVTIEDLLRGVLARREPHQVN